MAFTRREFIRGGVSAFTFSFAAPAFLSDLARAQGSARRNLVVLYLSGGNDALSMVVPYTDAQYYARRPVLGIPAANVLQIGRDSAGNALGLNPRLTGLKSIFDSGRLALIQRTGLRELEPLAFPGHRHLVHGEHGEHAGRRAGSGATSTRFRRRSIRSSAGRRCATCRTCCRRTRVGVAAIPSVARLLVLQPEPRHGRTRRSRAERRRASRRTFRSTCRTWRS